jgi:DNA modification methylase
LPKPLYETGLGSAYVGDASDLLTQLQDETVDLVLTSPPFALQRQKEYGNKDQTTYVDWLLEFCREIYRILREGVLTSVGG